MTLPKYKNKKQNNISSTPLISMRKSVLLITGISGAGRSTSLKILEDLSYEAVDNLPLKFLSTLASSVDGIERPLAIGIDVRTRGFQIDKFFSVFDTLKKKSGSSVKIIFLDCDNDVLQRRFTETRRRHPLAADRPVMDGILKERQAILGLRHRADLIIDTSELSLNDLKQILSGHFSVDEEIKFFISVISFSYRRGVPRESDLVFDARFLANPFYEDSLKELTGMDQEVADFVARDPYFKPFFDSLKALLNPLLPRFKNEGKSYLTISIGCTGGRHRSVFVVEELVKWLQKTGNHVDFSHRELPKIEKLNPVA